MHTKGPWEVVEEDNGNVTIRNTSTTAIMTEPLPADQRGVVLAIVQCMFARQDSVERARANARLMATAPELLEALETALEIRCLSHAAHARETDEEWQEISDLIAKVKGDQ